jgi:hypothetical protein
MTDGRNPNAARSSATPDPQRNLQSTGIAEKGPFESVSGDEPMTGQQASSLKTLSEQALEPEAYKPGLTRAEAERRINALAAKLRLASDPPHTA